ncbi:restriction endonuclease [Calothrix sp. NIES-3974]|uniref:restriction endonuclease n=1 Tax=Calothrix sp. NIES-3974 TaxID=2005462 RepID=UPI000B5F0F95|nr:restriction endonuclease [Calothrix sp. NIES-3974]BAZ07973.1 type II site-specific deoxyribonuclease [Calothrix sp. NIES-3974]
MQPILTITDLCVEAAKFAEIESVYDEPILYGVTDGKAIGTYLEQKFTAYLAQNYNFQPGNSASGIDIPTLDVDIKVTSIKQPQSSCPFQSATQKVFGLGYHLLVFVYDKYDDLDQRTGRLDLRHTVFVDKSRTGDFQTTRGILDILNRDGNKDDIVAFIMERNLPVDEIGASQLADRILESPPNQGYLTISNALQWRLQYSRIIQQAGIIPGIIKIR